MQISVLNTGFHNEIVNHTEIIRILPLCPLRPRFKSIFPVFKSATA